MIVYNCVIALQCVESVLFLDLCFKRKYTGIRFWGSLLLMAAVYALLVNGSYQPGLFTRMGLSILLYCLIGCSLFSGKTIPRLVISCVFFAIANVVDALYVYLILGFVSVDLNGLMSSRWGFPTVALSEQFLLICILLVLRRGTKKESAWLMNWKRGLAPLMLAIVSIGMSFFIFDSNLKGNASDLVLVVCNAFLVLFNVFVLASISWIEREMYYKGQEIALSEKIKAQKNSNEALSMAYTSQRRMTHDYRAQLLALTGMLQGEDSGKAREYVNSLLELTSEQMLSVRTCNPIADAIFNQKAFIAKKEKIEMHFTVSDLSHLKIDVSDFSVIVGNIIDNAIEASMKLPEKERLIEVNAVLQDTFTFSVRNRSEVVEIKNQQIMSTKGHALQHGFGISNVKAILKKYTSSCCDYSYCDGWFYFLIEMPNHAPEKTGGKYAS